MIQVVNSLIAKLLQLLVEDHLDAINVHLECEEIKTEYVVSQSAIIY